jgi:hypothetical protein
VYLLVGPIWVAKEMWMVVTGSHHRAQHAETSDTTQAKKT